MKKVSVFALLANLFLACSAQASMTVAEERYCDQFAELHRQAAILVDPSDPDGDAAYNLAADLCEDMSYDRVLEDARGNGCSLRQIAGGWETVCDQDYLGEECAQW